MGTLNSKATIECPHCGKSFDLTVRNTVNFRFNEDAAFKRSVDAIRSNPPRTQQPTKPDPDRPVSK